MLEWKERNTNAATLFKQRDGDARKVRTPMQLQLTMFSDKDIRRFWSHVNKDGPIPAHRPELGPCWIWTARPGGSGYGRILVQRVWYPAHRFSWLLAHMFIPDGLFVLHRCDNKLCIRPDHLFVGTASENMQDSANKGRNIMQRHPERSNFHVFSNVGEANHAAKLKEADVREVRQLRAAGMYVKDIAALYSMSEGAIDGIVSGRNWKHVK